MKKVCTYSRYSSEAIKEQRSAKYQKMLSDFFTQHKDYENLQNFVDVNIKANNGVTVKDDILQMSKLGNLDMVIVPTAAMLGRDSYEVAEFLRKLGNNGCEVYLVQEQTTANREDMLYRLLDTFPRYIPPKDYPTSSDVQEYIRYVEQACNAEYGEDEIVIKIGESEITFPMNEDNYHAIKNALEDIAEYIGLEQTM